MEEDGLSLLQHVRVIPHFLPFKVVYRRPVPFYKAV